MMLGIRPPSGRVIVRLELEKVTARLNGFGHTNIVLPDKHDAYCTGEHVPSIWRAARIVAIGASARRRLGFTRGCVLLHFAAGEPLGRDKHGELRLVSPDQIVAMLE